jgi:hypothetical protein
MAKKVSIPVTEESFHAVFARVMNGIAGLTPRQLEVISEFISYGIVTTRIRKVIRKKLNFRSVSAFNLIIGDLKKKGALIAHDGKLEINPYLMPEDNQKKITIEFVWKETAS